MRERYSRQVLFAPIGEAGQERLLRSSIAVVGCGAIGSTTAALLARAGVGRLRIIDRDYVEAGNLQRQSLFDESDARESVPKAIAAEKKLSAANSSIQIAPQVADLTPANIGELLDGTDLVLDATDNFQTRYLLNDFCVREKIPWIYAGVVGSYCVTVNIIPQETACLACLYPEPPVSAETCDTVGVLGAAANLVASIQAAEAIKFLVGARAALRRTLFSYDVWSGAHAEVSAAHPDPACRACGARDFVYLAGRAHPHITLCGRDSVQIHERERAVDFAALERALRPHGRVKRNEYVLKFWHGAQELTLFRDGRAIIKGTTDAAAARSLYARFIGS